MDVIDLPLMYLDSRLRDAVAAMRRYERRAVVGTEGNSFWLFKVGQVFRGLAAGRKNLSELERQWPVAPVMPPALNYPWLNVVFPHQAGSEFEKFLDSAGASYALTSASRAVAVVVTRHESLAAEVSGGPKDCYCSNEPPHEFPPPKVSTGQKCPICEKPVYCDF